MRERRVEEETLTLRLDDVIKLEHNKNNKCLLFSLPLPPFETYPLSCFLLSFYLFLSTSFFPSSSSSTSSSSPSFSSSVIHGLLNPVLGSRAASWAIHALTRVMKILSSEEKWKQKERKKKRTISYSFEWEPSRDDVFNIDYSASLLSVNDAHFQGLWLLIVVSREKEAPQKKKMRGRKRKSKRKKK